MDTLHFAKEGHKTLEGIVAIIDKQEKQQSDAHLKAVVQRSKSMAPYLTHASEEERKSQEPQPHDKKKKKKEGKELGRIPMEKFAAGRAHRYEYTALSTTMILMQPLHLFHRCACDASSGASLAWLP